MGDIGTDLAHSFHQPRQAIDGAIDLAGYDVDIVAVSLERYATCQVAMRDFDHCLGDAIKPPLRSGGEPYAPADCKRDHQGGCPSEAHEGDGFEAISFGKALADDQPVCSNHPGSHSE